MQNVYTLLCERDLPMALVTIPNILNFLEPKQKLIVVGDGSLSERSIDLLRNLSPNLVVITRKEREELILDKIQNFNHCIKFRDEFPLAFKLIDIPILAQKENSRFTFTDSDIIYLKNCKSYFNRPMNTYLRTDGIKISVRLKNAFFKYKWSIPFKFNSGYFSYDVNEFDLDFVNYFVSRPDVRNMPWVIEQTGWALLFGKSEEMSCPSEEQFICRENFEGPLSNTLAIHLIGPLKGKYNEWSIISPEYNSNITPIFIKSRNVTLMDWAKKSANRFLFR